LTFQQIQKYENGKNRAIWSPSRSTFRSMNSSAVLRRRVPRRGRQNQWRLTPKALRFAEAFAKISDKGLRSWLVDVVEAMARKSDSQPY
jgi:hypothetical protein